MKSPIHRREGGIVSDRQLLETDLDKVMSVRVDASRVFHSATRDVESAVDEMLPVTKAAMEALREEFRGDNAVLAAKTVMDSYVKLHEIRAKIKGDHEKLLVEMQKDINKCAVERKRIEVRHPPIDPSQLSDDQIRLLLESSP